MQKDKLNKNSDALHTRGTLSPSSFPSKEMPFLNQALKELYSGTEVTT